MFIIEDWISSCQHTYIGTLNYLLVLTQSRANLKMTYDLAKINNNP